LDKPYTDWCSVVGCLQNVGSRKRQGLCGGPSSLLRANLLELEQLRHGLEVVREAGVAEANGRAAEEVAHTHLAQLALPLQCIIRQGYFVKHLMYNVLLERYRLPSSVQKTPESRWPMHRERRTKAVFGMISLLDSSLQPPTLLAIIHQ